jgi:hypothetical protein
MMIVKLSARLSDAPREQVAVATLEEASSRVREYIDRYQLGASQFTGGDVFVRLGARNKNVGRISYNGKIWNDSKPYPKYRQGR